MRHPKPFPEFYPYSNYVRKLQINMFPVMGNKIPIYERTLHEDGVNPLIFLKKFSITP